MKQNEKCGLFSHSPHSFVLFWVYTSLRKVLFSFFFKFCLYFLIIFFRRDLALLFLFYTTMRTMSTNTHTLQRNHILYESKNKNEETESNWRRYTEESSSIQKQAKRNRNKYIIIWFSVEMTNKKLRISQREYIPYS